MALEHVVRDADGDGTSVLLCGKPDCAGIAMHLLEFEWNGWTGLIGACEEHREDLQMLRIRSREAEGSL